MSFWGFGVLFSVGLIVYSLYTWFSRDNGSKRTTAYCVAALGGLAGLEKAYFESWRFERFAYGFGTFLAYVGMSAFATYWVIKRLNNHELDPQTGMEVRGGSLSKGVARMLCHLLAIIVGSAFLNSAIKDIQQIQSGPSRDYGWTDLMLDKAAWIQQTAEKKAGRKLTPTEKPSAQTQASGGDGQFLLPDAWRGAVASTDLNIKWGVAPETVLQMQKYADDAARDPLGDKTNGKFKTICYTIINEGVEFPLVYFFVGEKDSWRLSLVARGYPKECYPKKFQDSLNARLLRMVAAKNGNPDMKTQDKDGNDLYLWRGTFQKSVMLHLYKAQKGGIVFYMPPDTLVNFRDAMSTS